MESLRRGELSIRNPAVSRYLYTVDECLLALVYLECHGQLEFAIDDLRTNFDLFIAPIAVECLQIVFALL